VSRATRFDVTSLGEAMLRLSVPSGQRLHAIGLLQAHIGGAESNVLIALAALGRQTAWHSQVPDSLLGRMVLRRLRAAGVDTGGVALEADGRLGIYFYEPAAGPLPGEVIYDRADSSFTRIRAEQVDWDALLDTRIVHLTGVTPALGDASRRLFEELFDRARASGVPISLDVNYRSKLWDADEANALLRRILPSVDLLICGTADARRVFGLQGDGVDLLEQLAELNGGRDTVLTCGAEGAMALTGGVFHSVESVSTGIVDRLGTGDAFAAGVIDGWLDSDLATGLRRGAVLAAVKLDMHGDSVEVTRGRLEMLVERKIGSGILR